MSNEIARQEKVRINVRRNFLWLDFKRARTNKVKPEDNLKVVFVGECAIDDGGPKREFFTGGTVFLSPSIFCFHPTLYSARCRINKEHR